MPGKTPTQNYILNSIINQMAAEKGEHLTVETRRALRERLLNLIEDNIIAALPDDKLAELHQLTERGMTDDELQVFLNGAGIDFVKATGEAVNMFRKVYMAVGELGFVGEMDESEEE